MPPGVSVTRDRYFRLGLRALAILLVSGFGFFSPPSAAALLALCATEQAGAISTLATPVISNQRYALQVFADSGSPTDCETVMLPVTPGVLVWGRLIRPALLAAEDATIILQGQWEEDLPTISEVIVPQNETAPAPTPQSLRAPVTDIVDHRASWLWQPDWWRSDTDTTWALVMRENLQRLYITVPVTGSAVAEPEQLAQFLQEAHDRDLEIWAVVGDRRDVLPESLPALLNRAAAYRQFNASRPVTQQLAGLQLDIEPYLLPGFNLDQAFWRTRYVETIRAVHDDLNAALPLDLVMPVWWGAHPVWGETLLASLPVDNLGITIMNYRTDEARLQAEVQPFLAWGETAGVAVQVALEFGELPDETRWHFYPDSARGELWELRLGEQRVLVLLATAQAGLPGRSWLKAFTSDYPAANLTFNGNREQLDMAISRLSARWSAWSSFAGIAIHGAEALQAGREFE